MGRDARRRRMAPLPLLPKASCSARAPVAGSTNVIVLCCLRSQLTCLRIGRFSALAHRRIPGLDAFELHEKIVGLSEGIGR